MLPVAARITTMLARLGLPTPDRSTISRRSLLRRLIAAAGTFSLGLDIFKPVGWSAARLIQIENGDGGASAVPVKLPAQGATIEGYLAKPAGSGPHPAVILHGEFGLDESVRDASRRYARNGLVALAVDPLSRCGGTDSFTSPADARRAIASLDSSQLQDDLAAAHAYLQSHPSVRKDHIRLGHFS